MASDQPPSYRETNMQALQISRNGEDNPACIDRSSGQIEFRNSIDSQQQLYQRQQHNLSIERFYQHPKLHYRLGIVSTAIGGVMLCIDPLVPLLIGYQCTLSIASFLMIASGIASIAGCKRKNDFCLIIALVSDALASLNLMAGLVAGIIFAFVKRTELKQSQIAFSIFNIIYCCQILIILGVDIFIKSIDVCYKRRSSNTEER